MTTDRQIAEVKSFLVRGGLDFPDHYNTTKYATSPDGSSVFTDAELAQMREREHRRAVKYAESVDLDEARKHVAEAIRNGDATE